MADGPGEKRAVDDERSREQVDEDGAQEAGETPPEVARERPARGLSPAERSPGEAAATRWVPAGRPAVPDDVAFVLHAASVLLDHPAGSAEDPSRLVAAATGSSRPGRAGLLRFMRWWDRLAADERERCYEETFDLDPGVTLFLQAGRPGASRERAERLAESRALGRGSPRRDELPDYLPLLLQVAARLPAARPALVAERPALEALAAGLARRGSPFADVVAAVLAVLPAA